MIPEAVLDEIQSGPADDPMRRLLPNCNWLVTVRLDTPLLPETSPRLGDGEAAVLEYSRMHGNLPVVVDDRAARRRAQSLGLKVYGTLSLIAMAAAQGHIASFTTAVQQLKAAGSYVSDDVIDAVRKTLK